MSAALKLPEVPEEPEATMADERFVREVIRGVEMMSPRPARRHTRSASSLNVEIGYRFDGPKGFDRGPGGWTILVEPELKLEGNDPVVPDLAGWREERAPEEDTNDAAYYTAPDWVCEVQSPGTKKWDRETKMPFYAFHRVGHLWIVEPIEKWLEVYALGRRGWELLGSYTGNKKVKAEPFEQVELDLSLIWPKKKKAPAR